MLHKIFDKVYVINLEKSEDRRKNIEIQCHSIGTHFELVKAVDGVKDNVHWVQNNVNSKYEGWTQGAAGLVYTTLSIIKDAKTKGYKSILILEDDIVFKPNVYNYVKQLVTLLPDNWELMHFAAQHFRKPKRYGRLLRCKGAWSCQFYAINETAYDEYIEWLELVDRPIDSITSGVFHPKGNSYASRGDLIDTIPNWSTIRDRHINYGVK